MPDLRREGGDIDRFAYATAAVLRCSSVGRGIFRPKMKLFLIKITPLFISEYTKKSVKQSDIANIERFRYILQIFSGSAKLGRNRQNSDISLSDITKFDCNWSVSSLRLKRRDRIWLSASRESPDGNSALSKRNIKKRGIFTKRNDTFVNAVEAYTIKCLNLTGCVKGSRKGLLTRSSSYRYP